MALNYGTLKTKILADAHVSNASAYTSKVEEFVRHAEGVINRRLRAPEMIKRVDLTDSDRVTAGEGIFTLPSDFLEERALYLEGTTQVKLENVSLEELRSYSKSMAVRLFSVLSDSEIEFRGVPGTAATIELIYFSRVAAFENDTDENDILTRHESIYVHAAQSALYFYAQDIELASAASELASSAIEALNEQTTRMLGGQRQSSPHCFSSYGRR